MYIHSKKLGQSVLSNGCCSQLFLEQGKLHDCGNELFMSDGWNAEAMEPNAYHQAEDLDDNDNATKDGLSDRVMAELRIDVFQDVKAMTEHNVDLEVSTIIGTETKIVEKVSSWKLAGITWVRMDREQQRGRRTRRLSNPGITQRRDHRLVVLQSISYSIGWTVHMTAKS